MPSDSQKHLNNECLPWKQNKRYSVHFTFSDSFNGTPNSPQNFKSLKSGVVEIREEAGGSQLLSIRCGYQTFL